MITEDEMRKKLERAKKDLIKADALTEKATMAVWDVFHSLNFAKVPLTPAGSKILSRMDKAHNWCGDAREALGEIVYQIEQALKVR